MWHVMVQCNVRLSQTDGSFNVFSQDKLRSFNKNNDCQGLVHPVYPVPGQGFSYDRKPQTTSDAAERESTLGNDKAPTAKRTQPGLGGNGDNDQQKIH